jgi:hypothetical protein
MKNCFNNCVVADMRGKLMALAFALLVPCSASFAQQAQLPQDLQETATAETTKRILVIGDTLSGGLGAGLKRLTESEQKYDVTFRPNESSGLARPEIYDWAQALPSIFEANEYWAVVIMIGSNDRRDIEGKVFRSEEWVAAYKKNVETLLDALKAQNARVFWASNPPFSEQSLDADMMFINGLHREIVEVRGETFIDLYKPLLGGDGKYTDTGADNTGTVRKLRARDGVGFYKEGNNRMAQILLGEIQIREADEVFEKAPVTAQALPATPLFGRTDVNGEPVILKSDEVAESMKQVAANTTASQVKIPVATTPVTDADILFATGKPVTGPRGRFDDFSVAPSSSP